MPRAPERWASTAGALAAAAPLAKEARSRPTDLANGGDLGLMTRPASNNESRDGASARRNHSNADHIHSNTVGPRIRWDPVPRENLNRGGPRKNLWITHRVPGDLLVWIEDVVVLEIGDRDDNTCNRG